MMFIDMTVYKKEIERLEELGEMVSLYCVPNVLSFCPINKQHHIII